MDRTWAQRAAEDQEASKGLEDSGAGVPRGRDGRGVCQLHNFPMATGLGRVAETKVLPSPQTLLLSRQPEGPGLGRGLMTKSPQLRQKGRSGVLLELLSSTAKTISSETAGPHVGRTPGGVQNAQCPAPLWVDASPPGLFREPDFSNVPLPNQPA